MTRKRNWYVVLLTFATAAACGANDPESGTTSTAMALRRHKARLYKASLCPRGTKVIRGTAGNDNLVGTPADECIFGLEGDDRIDGGGGKDVIFGGPGNDVIRGAGKRTKIYGEDGNDIIDPGTEGATVDCGSGDDVATVSGAGCETVLAPDPLCRETGECSDTSLRCEPLAGVCLACTDDVSCGGVEACTDDVSCSDGNACTEDTCDPTVGCAHAALTGTTCPLLDEQCAALGTCKQGTCSDGACVACLSAASCSDGNECTSDSCDPVSGCSHEPLSGTSCSVPGTCDGDVCQPGICNAGACVGSGSSTYYGPSIQPPAGPFTQVSAGDSVLALRPDGSAIGWMVNTYGQATPPADEVFTQISAGDSYSCGIKADTSIVCWGSTFGTPPAGAFQQVSCGRAHACALQLDGSVVCWGNNTDGESTAPAGTFIQVSAGFMHSCAIASDHSVVCWGDDTFGQATAPAGSFIDVSAGLVQTCGITVDHALVCWGSQSAYDLPTGSFSQVSTAHMGKTYYEGTMTYFAQAQDCALTTAGAVVCWGGSGGLSEMSGPPIGGDFIQVSSGTDHSCALSADGSITCWGRPDSWAGL